MRWYKDGKIDEEGKMIHPSDSEAWKDLDKQYPWFAQDPRNVRLGLATDGFNPFGNMNNSYSIWPMILVPYNLPPWLCMKEPYFIMSLLIPGPKSPGRDIDVYLRPLIDDLKELWESGVRTRDAKTGELFVLHAAILWTINDFPAYGDIYGHRTKGYCACPRCSADTPSEMLRSKIGYIDHIRYLPHNNPYRRSLKFNDVDGKTKDTEKARLDLEDMGVRSELHLNPVEGVKFPDGYASNISRCVNIKDGLRGYVQKDVLNAITELTSFFRQLCSRKLSSDVLDNLEKIIPIILSKLEMIFPPAFFDVMVHLAIHLTQEGKIGGPVHYRWMYPIEMYLGSLKGMVRNRARPEGSIAEAYIVKECLSFCSLYLHDIETKYNRDQRNYDGEEHPNATLSVFRSKIRTFGEAEFVQLTPQQYSSLHWFVLNDCVELDSYVREHKEELKQQHPIGWETRQKKEFATWFDNRIKKLRSIKSPEATDELIALACGPDYRINKCSGCIVEGVNSTGIEILEKIIHPRVHDDKDEEDDDDGEDETQAEYWSSDDEVASHAIIDSDLE
ncbi:PREDICTED: uncharacterized protein LOC105967723 [Erythranthe guttata]|uniref:uncharacterized protein LOC105967723 n=1 Tax=Erythranthe guttata TaxID=4155 RepID=UPI00064DE8CA|nr:PREDICTED: uncharacterized protein LOC105967723 [Erythranthe guttata]|eukprot:XP_012847795.1 PREDICTED: uncharacterized protein LOC105967723 [Erythranthe guttata]